MALHSLKSYCSSHHSQWKSPAVVCVVPCNLLSCTQTLTLLQVKVFMSLMSITPNLPGSASATLALWLFEHARHASCSVLESWHYLFLTILTALIPFMFFLKCHFLSTTSPLHLNSKFPISCFPFSPKYLLSSNICYTVLIYYVYFLPASTGM